jgi:hypothetical protein
MGGCFIQRTLGSIEVVGCRRDRVLMITVPASDGKANRYLDLDQMI